VEQCGLRPEEQVVCYDAANGSMAARLWWMLRWIGHDAVAVLDGGLAKWLAEKRPVTAEIPHFPPSRYPMKLRQGSRVEVVEVLDRAPNTLLLDARAAVRYRGEQEPIDPVAGHIPGAMNRFNGNNVKPDGTFKDAASLRQEFLQAIGNRPATDVVHYCGSGVAACHNLLAMEIAGLPGGKLYAGSWSEWIADPARPVAR
jgi:thiosulfate/3-mercaptopyruvate sulfurtransferase